MNISTVPSLEDLEARLGGLSGKRILVRCDFNVPVRDGESDLYKSMKQIAETGKGPEKQIPSAGCGIKWKNN